MISASVARTAVRHAPRVGCLRVVSGQTKSAHHTTRVGLLGAASLQCFSGTRVVFLTKAKTPSGKKKSVSLKAQLKTIAAREEKATTSKIKAAKKKKASTKQPAKQGVRKLTPEQRERAKDKRVKRELIDRKKMLKEVSLIKDEPRPGYVNPYIAFTGEKGPALRARGLGITDTAKKLGEMYKALPESEMEKYRSIARANRKTYHATLAAWVKKRTPTEIAAANKARSSLKRLGLPTRVPIQDERLPTGPLTAYICFVKEFTSDVSGTMPGKAAIIEAAAKWKELSPEEKKPYEQLAEKDKKRYEKECEAVFGS